MKNPMSNGKIRVSIVESNPLFMEGYLQLLSCDRNIAVMDHDTSARQLFERMNGRGPDVVLSNVESADWDATELWTHIRLKYPETKIIINGSIHPGPLVKLLMHQGVSSYFVKDGISKNELVRIVLETYYTGVSKTTVVTDEILAGIELPKRMPPQHGLSDREFQILELTCQGLNRKDISGQLSIAESTVKFHLDKMRERFRCSSLLQLAIHAMREGIVSI